MILCPNCQHKEASGAVFCSECGAQLAYAADLSTETIVTVLTEESSKNGTAPYHAPPPVSINAWISLHIIDTGQILPLADRTEFALGRVSEGQPIMPDVDLSVYNAYARGVSRLHCVLKMVDERIVIMDLGSANGTYLNGNRLTPHVEENLTHGDILSLGKLKIQVLFGQQDAKER